MRQRFAVVTALLAALVIPVAAQQKVLSIQDLFQRNLGTAEQQNKQVPPHKIVGNLYYVGTEMLSSFLVTTPQGHILIDSIYERNVPTIQDSVQKLDFNAVWGQ